MLQFTILCKWANNASLCSLTLPRNTLRQNFLPKFCSICSKQLRRTPHKRPLKPTSCARLYFIFNLQVLQIGKLQILDQVWRFSTCASTEILIPTRLAPGTWKKNLQTDCTPIFLNGRTIIMLVIQIYCYTRLNRHHGDGRWKL
jgi:hypothetical protein